MQTRRGVYLEISESTYSAFAEGLIFYFSSKIYRDKFKKILNQYIKEETQKLYIKYGVKFDVKQELAVSLYKKIEKRGYRVEERSCLNKMSIRWRHKDYVKLGRAVSDFNRKVNELETISDSLNLPEPVSYEELVYGENKILTRQEFNRIVKSLRRFLDEKQQEIVNVGNFELTRWERNQLIAGQRRLNLETEARLNESKLRRDTDSYKAIKGMQNTYTNLKNTNSKEAFNHYRKRLTNYLRADRKLRKDAQFRENYMKMYKHFEQFDNYELFEGFLNSFSSDKEFSDFILTHPFINDIYAMYGLSEGNEYIVDVFEQEQFNEILWNLGLIDEMDIEVRDIERQGEEYAIIRNRDDKVLNTSSNYEELEYLLKNQYNNTRFYRIDKNPYYQSRETGKLYRKTL